VKTDVSEVETYEVKFKSAGPAPVILEAVLLVLKVPAAPAVWQARLDEAAASQADTDVLCGQPFCVEIEALDTHGNR
jgi:hypothetical protein